MKKPSEEELEQMINQLADIIWEFYREHKERQNPDQIEQTNPEDKK